MNRKIRLTSHGPRATSDKCVGSALILAVVLTSLLAIIGVMFIMMARVDRMATSAISENKELNFAIETVVAKISQELVLDVPGVAGQEYYDYPGLADKWLANLEPNKSGSNYYWRQISDVYNKNFPIPSQGLQAVIVPDYQVSSQIGDSNNSSYSRADADGDGVADSVWVRIPEMTSNKGKPIYAAVRIVDNGGMINVNTARRFDPNSTVKSEIDGSSQTQINLLALSKRGSTSNPLGKLDDARFGSEPHNLNDYIKDVVWQYNEPNGAYTPFDIGDELKLRNRYILNYNLMVSRIEELWENVYDVGPRTPIPTSAYPFSRWPNCTILGTVEPNDYDYRHISTTYNFDRIIDPNGDKMVNINDPNVSVGSLYSAIKAGLYDAEPNFADVNNVAAQMAVNLIDFRDSDSDVASISVDGSTYYGFESPCIYISELAHRFKKDTMDPNIVYKSYAVELYKPYSGDNDPCNWQLEVGGTSIPINNWTGNKQFYVIQDQNLNAPLDVNLGTTVQPASFTFTDDTEISLQRPLPGGGYVTVDWYRVDPCIPAPWLSEDGSPHSIQRDIQPHKCIRRLWASVARNDDDELGKGNTFVNSDPNVIQAHPEDKPFTNVGEIEMVFVKSAYSEGPNPIGLNDTEATARLNLADSKFRQIFNYLTVFDPNSDTIDNDGDGLIDALDTNTPEYKVAGRININTAPWFVIAQLPWVSQRINRPLIYELAQTIVYYRDQIIKGFRGIGQVNIYSNDPGSRDFVMNYYALDSNDLADYPDLTPGDEAIDDFEERDVIFARISNLITVRSDVFTAYILVRIGTDGPQKRALAILDRSNVYSPADKVKIVALHPIPDPR